jgi:hypothetical protein
MKILFLHGWQSVPGGVKPTFLAQHGHQVISPKLPDKDFEGLWRYLVVEPGEPCWCLKGSKTQFCGAYSRPIERPLLRWPS